MDLLCFSRFYAGDSGALQGDNAAFYLDSVSVDCCIKKGESQKCSIKSYLHGFNIYSYSSAVDVQELRAFWEFFFKGRERRGIMHKSSKT